LLFIRSISARAAATALFAAGALATPMLLTAPADADTVTSTCVAHAETAEPAVSALNCTPTGTLSLKGGGLLATLPGELGWSGTITGADQDVRDTDHTSIEVDDLTGTGAGWHITASATQFTGTASSSHTLSVDALSVNGSTDANTPHGLPTATCATAGKCTLPKNAAKSVSYPATVGATTGVIYSADAGSGLGKIDLGLDWWVHIPATAYADTYTSTITLAVVSGP
jgi:hypothetical protein